MAESSKLRLRVTGPDGSKKTLELSGTSFIVGSGEEAALRLTDAKVADLHVRLRLKDGQLTVTDLGSDAGSTIDGSAVGKDAVLKAGQVLQVGDTQIAIAEEKPKFEKGGSAAPQASGGKQGKGAKGKGVQVTGASAAVAASATDGNAALQIAPGVSEVQDEEEEVSPTAETAIAQPPEPPAKKGKGSAAGDKKHQVEKKGRSVLDQVVVKKDDRLKDYAARFLSDTLPESLRPTATNKRLQVALLWGSDQFLDIKDLAPGQSLTVGDAAGATFHVFHQSLSGAVPLIQPQGNEFRVLLPAGASAKVRTGGESVAADKLVAGGKAQSIDVPVKGASYTIGLEDRVNIEFGNLQVIARYTKPQLTKSRPAGERLDVDFLSKLLILLMVAVAFERMIAITDFSDLNLSDDLFKNKDRFAKYIAKAEQKEKPKFEKLSGVKEGAKAKDDEGKFGKKEADKKEAAPSKKGAPVVDVNKREEDRKKVMKSGLLALLGGETAGATSNVFGPGGLGTGLNNALGGINGAGAMGDAQGVGGLGARGGGAGGGGTALGIGGLGGKGSGRGRGGSGEFDLGGTGKASTTFVPGKTTVVGGLTADEVGRIIRRHWNEIKYCYEKELTKDPNLEGKVAVYFEIGPVGDVTVAQVKETTLNNANAEECMLGNVRRWKFPAPRGGGVVNVNYPFIFKSQG